MHARIAAELFERLNELQGKYGTKRLADGFAAAERVHGFHLRVPALDAVVEIDGEDAHVDGLDDVLVELLEALEFDDFFFEAGVEAGVLQSDADVAGERFEQLDIFAGEEVAAQGAAEADDGDGSTGAAFPLQGTRPKARSVERRLADANARRRLGHAAGQIVVEIEEGRGALLRRGQMQNLLGVLKENVRVIGGAIEVQEAKIEALRAFTLWTRFLGKSVRGGEAQAARFAGQEDGDAGYEERAGQLLHDGVEQRLQIGLRTEAAAELDQGLAVVVAMAVEGAIDPSLNAALEGIEDRGGNQDGDHQSPLAHRFRQPDVDHDRDEGDDAEVAAEDERRGQRISHAALEDQVGVHQPVADDGPTEGERQKHQREAGEIREQVRRVELQQIRNRVKERERQHREQGSAGDPLQLLAQERRGGAAVAAQEQQRGQDVKHRIVAGGDLVQAVEQQLGGRARADGPEPQPQQSGAGRVNQRQKPAAAQALEALLREAEREVEKERRLQGLGNDVGPEDGPVQQVEGRGVMESVERERDQAEEIEMRGAWRAPAAEEDVEADDQIDKADDAQTELQTAVGGHGNHLHRRVERNAVAGDAVAELDVGAGAVKGALEIRDRGDRNVIDCSQKIVDLDECLLAGRIGQHAVGHQTSVRLVPPHAVGGLLERALLKEIEDGKQEQSRRRQRHHCNLHAAEEALVHKREVSYAVYACT